jgi:hypothetical protein
MIFQNIHTFSIILSVLLILFVIYFFWVYYKNNRNVTSIIFLLFSVLCIIISLFSPRYWTYDKNISTDWWNVLFIMDVSKSMNVFDIQYWKNIISRLQAEKLVMSEFIQNNIWNKYWLFAFAGETLELLPFTNDAWLFQTILNWVDKNNVSKYWSDFQWLFQMISNYVEQEENAWTVVILTDGWEIENISLTQSIQQKIDKHNSKVIIIWVWTDKWWYILDWEDVFWRPVYKIYNWQKVISQVNKSWINKITNKYNFTQWYINTLDDMKNIKNIISDNITKQNYEKNISLSRDISYIFIILFTIFFTLFLITENEKSQYKIK